MVATYNILGAKVGSHYLAMGVLGLMFGGTFMATRGSSKKPANNTPPINASSPDEENFIKNFLDQANKDEKAAKH